MEKLRERERRIFELLRERQIASVAEIAAHCEVSEVTTRRDLRRLSEGGGIQIVGGAASLDLAAESVALSDKYYVTRQLRTRREEKLRIARGAVELIEPGETIIIDLGSTPYFFARSIPQGVPLTVLCYSLNTFIELHERRELTIHFAGGLFDPDSLVCESEEGVRMLSRFRANRAFVTASGLSDRLGITTSNLNEESLKKSAIANSDQRILLLDSSKFGVVRSVHVAEIEDFEVVITDADIPDRYEELIRSKGVELYKV